MRFYPSSTVDFFPFFRSQGKVWRVMYDISNKKRNKLVVSCLYELGFRIRVSPFVYTSVRVCSHATETSIVHLAGPGVAKRRT